MLDLNALPLPELFERLTADGLFARTLDIAAREDMGERGDVTTAALAQPEQLSRGIVAARVPCVAAGLEAVPLVLRAFSATLDWEPRARDGEMLKSPEALGELAGSLRELLAVERTLLNVLGRACGVATMTRRFVDAVAGMRAAICETRKTMPGLRALDKHAARCGGATLHRLGLHDAALFKDNHLAMLDPDRLTDELNVAARRARAAGPLRFLEVEVDSLVQLAKVLACKRGLIDIVLLDNMPPAMLREAVELRDRLGPDVQLEASGGVSLQNVREIAQTGVERISVGAITHSASGCDVALDLTSPPAARVG